VIETLFITTTRADYGILSNLIKIFHHNNEVFKILVSGTHLNEEYGLSLSEIKMDYSSYLLTVDILSGKVPLWDEIKNIYNEFPQILKELNPKKVIVLGDRYEIFHITSICLFLNIPIVHFHGGELSEGAIDDILRHSITKMSNLHFVSSNVHKLRVMQLGEDENSVFNFGSMSVNNIVDNFSNSNLTLEEYYNRDKIIVIYHPTTKSDMYINIFELIMKIKKTSDKKVLVFTPNNDPGRDLIYSQINQLEDVTIIKNLNYSQYLNILSSAYCIVGNSSSGIIEAPALRVPTINIGERQKNRTQLRSIINCKNIDEIKDALDIIGSSEFANEIINMTIPLYVKDGNYKIYDTLKKFEFTLQKKFWDMEIGK